MKRRTHSILSFRYVLAVVLAVQGQLALALSYDEVQCMETALNAGEDLTSCWVLGKGGGGAGNGGSGGGGSSQGGSSGGSAGGGGITGKLCAPPSTWFTGPPDPSTISYEEESSDDYRGSYSSSSWTAYQTHDGVRSQYFKQVVKYADGTTQYWWTVFPVSEDGLPDGKGTTSHCTE